MKRIIALLALFASFAAFADDAQYVATSKKAAGTLTKLYRAFDNNSEGA